VTFVCIVLVLALIVQGYFAWREREKLLRRIAEPQQVIVENAPKREKPERVWTDEQYRQLMLSRGQIPRDN
jgi:hypothetical protein